MKKLFTSILLIFITAVSVFAQVPLKGTPTYSAHTVPLQVNEKQYLNNFQHPRTRGAGTGDWYNYIAAEYLSNPYGVFNHDYLFPDSGIVVGYSTSSPSLFYTNPSIHGVSTVLDPKSLLFDNPLYHLTISHSIL